MRAYVMKVMPFLILVITASNAHALDVTFSDATGASEVIWDNRLGDGNPAPGVIDFRIIVFGLNFTAFARVQEVLVGQSVTLTITEIPGQIPVPILEGYFQDTSLGNPGVYTVTVKSSNFAAIPAGANWTIDYSGNAFDGPFPSTPNPCNGNGTVTIPSHFVTGSLNGGTAALGTVNGPVFLNAPPAPFSVSQMGVTPAPATSLQIDWTLDPDPCDGIQLPSSIEVVVGQIGDKSYIYYYAAIAVIVAFLLLAAFWVLRKRSRKTQGELQ